MGNVEPSEERKETESDNARKEGKPTDKSFYWVITLAALFFLYLFYSVLTHNTVNIHGH